MSWTRREFVAAGSLAASAAALGLPRLCLGAADLPYDDPAYLCGDPYLATTSSPGLGGRTFETARERAFRLRTPPAERDRSLLGLAEVPLA